MGQENLKGSEGSPHSGPWDRTHDWVWWLMPGIAALDRLGGGAISMRKELEQKGKKTVVGQAAGSVVMMRFQSPPSIASCVLSGECRVCTGWKIDFQLLAIRIHQVRAEWERGWLFIC